MYNNNNNNDDFIRNSHLSGINSSLSTMADNSTDELNIKLYGVEKAIEIREKRKFRRLCVTCGVTAFLVGFGLAYYFRNTELVKTVGEFFRQLL